LKRELQIKIAEQATLEDVVQQKKMEIERLLAISGDNYAAWQRREAELQQVSEWYLAFAKFWRWLRCTQSLGDSSATITELSI